MLLARLFEFGDRSNLELVIEYLNSFWAQSLNLDHVQQARWKRRFESLMVPGGTRLDKIFDGIGKALSNSLDLRDAVCRDELPDIFRQRFNDTGTVVVGTTLERVLSFDLEERSHFIEDIGNGLLIHG